MSYFDYDDSTAWLLIDGKKIILPNLCGPYISKNVFIFFSVSFVNSPLI